MAGQTGLRIKYLKIRKAFLVQLNSYLTNKYNRIIAAIERFERKLVNC